MCGISILYKNNINEGSEKFIIHRGPDGENFIEKDGFLMKHYLLSITGEKLNQPIEDGNIVCLFNGEIYNYKDFGDYKSDAPAIIKSYKKNGDNFVKNLDGEFAIFLVDFDKKVFYISTDIFGIKPLYYSLDNGIGVSSYYSFLEKNGYNDIKRLEPNTTLKIDFNFNILNTYSVYDFDLNQHKEKFDDWNSAFMEAIKKRFLNQTYDIILPLSSGLDSGAISLAMNLLNINYISYSFKRNENVGVINKRAALNKGVSIIKSSVNRNTASKIIRSTCEPFFYGYDYTRTNTGLTDPGALGLTFLLNETKEKYPNVKILASGQGGDEITSNLQAYKYRNPNPAVFGNDLSDCFPWDNFYKGSQSSYLSKEECVSGSFGIEGRYPFLDKMVVQEFLWLTPKLKNKYFKSPITNFLNIHNYPYSKVKTGFNA